MASKTGLEVHGVHVIGACAAAFMPLFRGTVFLELTYTPFARPTATATGAGASPAGTASTLSAADNRAIMPHDKVRPLSGAVTSCPNHC